jgi:PPOX class probable F420-dependent enzyme
MHTVPDSHLDLLETQFATLATIGPDGRPQLTEVWFLFKDGSVSVSLNSSRQKTRNLARNPACSLFILDPSNPFRYLELRGDAELLADDDYSFADQVGAKYGSDLRDHDGPDDRRVVARIHPKRVNALNMAG